MILSVGVKSVSSQVKKIYIDLIKECVKLFICKGVVACLQYNR